VLPVGVDETLEADALGRLVRVSPEGPLVEDLERDSAAAQSKEIFGRLDIDGFERVQDAGADVRERVDQGAVEVEQDEVEGRGASARARCQGATSQMITVMLSLPPRWLASAIAASAPATSVSPAASTDSSWSLCR